MECCRLFQPVFTTEGLCFTIQDVSPIADFVLGSPVIFSVVLDLTTPPKLDQQSDMGFRVYLTDPSEEVPVLFDSLDGQDVLPGLGTTIRANLVKMKRTALHTPWHSLWNTCPTWRHNDSYESDRYSHLICDNHLYEKSLREKCGCRSPLHGSSPSTLDLCEPMDMLQCYIRNELEIINETSDTSQESNCNIPCIVYSYRTQASYIGVGGDNNLSRIEIKYNAKQFTYKEYTKATLSGFFSQIGGSLGLYLGASIITIVEILIFTVTWLWYRLAPSKVVNKSAKKKPIHQPLSFISQSRYC